jgi:hypothetical protein
MVASRKHAVARAADVRGVMVRKHRKIAEN